MASRAQKVTPGTATTQPHAWWQWLMIYPALGSALITALPDWIDRGRAYLNGVNAPKYSIAEQQLALWKKNISCHGAPTIFHPTQANAKVDATICKKSGDVFIQVEAFGRPKIIHWVGLDEILGIDTKPSLGLIPGARAAATEANINFSDAEAPMQSRDPRLIRAQAQYTNIVCQKFIDQRFVLRHLQTPQGCFDEIIDTLNGVVVKRTPTPCRGGC